LVVRGGEGFGRKKAEKKKKINHLPFFERMIN
jgi:hypothetical protein